jgi:UDP-galactopyranose mutase
MAQIDGKFTPTPFNFRTIDDFYSPEYRQDLKDQLLKAYPNQEKATIVELLKHPQPDIRAYAEFLFEKDYSLYTAKQWGISPSEIDVSVLNRVPVLFSYKNGYFDDTYQVMPAISYTHFFENLLNHPNIEVVLNCEALEHLKVSAKENTLLLDGHPINIPVIYTGALDELFGQIGELPYRSLSFEWKYEKLDSFQDAPVVAYPQAEKFTRITEYKKLPIQNVSGTTYAVEYPLQYKSGNGEPYYPVLTEESKQLYNQFKLRASNIKNLVCCGRLADFKYYNMDQALDRALNVCSNLSSYF